MSGIDLKIVIVHVAFISLAKTALYLTSCDDDDIMMMMA